MARRYSTIWAELKSKKKVIVKCRAEKVRTLVQAVKKEKARENAPKTALDLPSFGLLRKAVRILENGMAQITFTLEPATRAEDL